MKKLIIVTIVFFMLAGFIFYRNDNVIYPVPQPALTNDIELKVERDRAPLISPNVEDAKLTYQEKIDKEIELNKLAVKKHQSVPLSGLELYNSLVKRGIFVPSDVADRMKSDRMGPKDLELINTYIAGILTEEENFKIELSQYSNFNTLKQAFENRTKTTGIYYGNDFLSQRFAYKDASLADVKSIIDTGATLPDDTLKNIIASENIELAKELQDSGYNINVNYVDDFSSMNAMELLAEDLAIKSYKYSADQQVELIKAFIDLGVPLKTRDGTRDAIDYLLNTAVNQDAQEASKLMRMASTINNAGLRLENSHLELLKKLQGRYPDLYEEYINQFR